MAVYYYADGDSYGSSNGNVSYLCELPEEGYSTNNLDSDDNNSSEVIGSSMVSGYSKKQQPFLSYAISLWGYRKYKNCQFS